MELRRIAETLINKKIQPNKVILLLGARRVGKTEILKKIESEAKEKVIFLKHIIFWK